MRRYSVNVYVDAMCFMKTVDVFAKNKEAASTIAQEQIQNEISQYVAQTIEQAGCEIDTDVIEPLFPENN